MSIPRWYGLVSIAHTSFLWTLKICLRYKSGPYLARWVIVPRKNEEIGVVRMNKEELRGTIVPLGWPLSKISLVLQHIQCLKIPPNSSKFLLIPSVPTNNFCVTPHKSRCLYKTAITFWPIVQTDYPWHYLCRNLSGNFLFRYQGRVNSFKRDMVLREAVFFLLGD